MRLEIFWTDEATETFDSTVLFIETKWNESEAGSFVTQAQEILFLISEQPYMYNRSIGGDVRQVLITKQTSMYYEIHEGYITILYFWDNRQEPILQNMLFP